MNKWIPIFKTGTHTDSNGNGKTWTDSDLDNIVAKYDPSNHEAPVVIGHPQDNSPAWGWVEGMKKEGDLLFAKFKDLIPEFVDMVKKGLFKKRSISLYPDGALRHIGFLGATPPAVKGLPDIQFKGGEQFLIIEFEESPSPNPSLYEPLASSHRPQGRGINKGREGNENRKEDKRMKFSDLMKMFAKEKGVEIEDMPATMTADKPTFSEADVKAATEKAAREAKEKAASEFAETQKKKDDEFAEREKKLKDKEVTSRKKGITDFCEDLKKKGILTPAMEKLGMGITEFMQQIAGIETAVEFGEPSTSSGQKAKQTPLEFIQSFLGNLPKAIEFREVAGRDKDNKATGDFEALVTDYSEKNKVTRAKAISAIAREHPDLRSEWIEKINAKKGGK